MNDLTPTAYRTHDAALAEARNLLRQSMAAIYRPPPRLSVADWADQYRVLSTGASAVGGRWQTSRVEVARGAMLAASEPGVRTLTVMTATQLLKSSVLENVIGRHMHLDPCPILLLEPKDELAVAFSRERIAPMMKASEPLRKFADERTRVSGNTTQFKKFPGGFLTMHGAGSPTNLAMRSIRIVLMDEIDKYETTKEGDPVLLAEERMTTFVTNSLSIRACSPTIEEKSRIYNSWLESDQRRPFVQCPHCGHAQWLEFFKHVLWDKDADGNHLPETAAIHCEECGAGWTEAQRMRLMTTAGAIRYHQTRPFTHCNERQEPLVTRSWDWDDALQVGYATCRHCGERAVPNRHAGIGGVSKLYSPFATVIEIVLKFLSARHDPEQKQTFWNTQLGWPYRSEISREVSQHALAARCEPFPARPQVPDGVLVLTAGVDVQAGGSANIGRLELELVGWGLGEESWSLETPTFTGDPALPEVWAELDRYLLEKWRHPLGHEMTIEAACIDSGGLNTDEVYQFCRPRFMRNVWAIKGGSDRGQQWSPIWPPSSKRHGKKYRPTWRPIILGVNSGKESVRQRLLVEEPGPGYCHFPLGRPDSWFDGLTSEDLVMEKHAGVVEREWRLKSGRVNEPIDCRVYSYAALQGLKHMRGLDLGKRFAKYATPPAPQNPVAPSGRRIHRSRFMRG